MDTRADIFGCGLTLAENIAAARSIGMRAYQIDRTLTDPTADGRIGSLLDLIGLLASPGAEPEPRPHSPSPYDTPA